MTACFKQDPDLLPWVIQGNPQLEKIQRSLRVELNNHDSALNSNIGYLNANVSPSPKLESTLIFDPCYDSSCTSLTIPVPTNYSSKEIVTGGFYAQLFHQSTE